MKTKIKKSRDRIGFGPGGNIQLIPNENPHPTVISKITPLSDLQEMLLNKSDEELEELFNLSPLSDDELLIFMD